MTQYLPPNDDLAAGSPTYSQLLGLYVHFRVTTTAVSFWNPSANAFAARFLHGGYQTLSSGGVADYNAAFYSNGVNARNPSGVLFRRPFVADVTVTGVFEMRSIAGAIGISELAPRGVIARAAGGSLVGDGTPDFWIADGTCYFAAVYQKTDSTLRLGIFRTNSGTLAQLAESGSIPTTSIDLKKLATVALTVSGSGTVSLSASVSGFGSTATLATANASDSSGSKITAAGRCGLLMGADRTFTSPSRACVDLCHALRVDEGSTLALQDEFRRLSLAGAKQTSADLNGIVGGYVTSAFYWDIHTFDGTFTQSSKNYTGSRRLRRNATDPRIDFDCQATDDDVGALRHAPGFMLLSQRPAGSRASQHRSVKIIMPNASIPSASTGDVWAGIVLRAQQNRPAIQSSGTPDQAISSNVNTSFGTGYLLVVRAKTNLQVIWQLHRVINNTHQVVARKTENSPFVGTAFPGYGVQFTVDFEVYPRNESDPLGPVVLRCKVNGSALALTEYPGGGSAPPAGWTNPSTGVFHDSSGSRIKQNPGEGLFVSNGLTSPASPGTANDYDPIFEAWHEETLTNAAALDIDQDSIAVLPEAATVGADFVTVVGAVPFKLEPVMRGIETPYESGHVQSMPLELGARLDRLKFSEVVLPDWRLDALLDYWDAHNGTEIPFSFTPDGGSTLKCHFVGSRIEFSPLSPNAYAVTFELERMR